MHTDHKKGGEKKNQSITLSPTWLVSLLKSVVLLGGAALFLTWFMTQTRDLLPSLAQSPLLQPVTCRTLTDDALRSYAKNTHPLSSCCHSLSLSLMTFLIIFLPFPVTWDLESYKSSCCYSNRGVLWTTNAPFTGSSFPHSLLNNQEFLTKSKWHNKK